MRIAGRACILAVAVGVGVVACASEPPTPSSTDEGGRATPRGARAAPPAATAAPGARPKGSASTTAAPKLGIGYQGGPVMAGTPDVYFIWYGGWANAPALTILPDFMGSLGGSPYLTISTLYTDASGGAVSGDVHYAGSTTDAYSQGKSLFGNAVEAIVASALARGALPASENAVYFVLASADVTLSGFCNQFCGWHTVGSGSPLATNVKYAFIGDPAACPQDCSPGSPTPNGDVGADGMASIMAHELEETLTDPELDAWINTGEQENADECAWQFGATYTTASGARANMRLGDRDYLIQENLDRLTNQCVLALPAPSALTVAVVSPAPGAELHASGPLDVVAHATDDAGVTVTSAAVHWTAAGTTTDFAMTKNAAGDWELSTTMSATAQPGDRTFTVTATDDTGHSVTSAATSVVVD